jgi:hypothetical protein
MIPPKPSGPRKLPDKWWLFLPLWLWLPFFFGLVLIQARAGVLVAFGCACLYLLLTMLAYVPVRKNSMGLGQAWLYMGYGTILIGLPCLALMYVLFSK